MEHFNKDLYEKAIQDHRDITSRYQAGLKEHLTTLELELSDELWQDFVSNGSKKIKEMAYSRLNSDKGIYSPSTDSGPVSIVLTKIANLYSLMIASNGRSRSQSHLIPLTASGIDNVISENALEALKNHCTTVIDDNEFKVMEAFKKAHNALNAIKPNTVIIECNYFSQDHDGSIDINYYHL